MKKREIPKKSDRDRDGALDRMIEFITESHLEHAGGYPYHAVEIGEEIVTAELDHDDAPHVGRYPINELLDWHDEAVEFLQDCSDLKCWDFASACHETNPGEIGTDYWQRFCPKCPSCGSVVGDDKKCWSCETRKRRVASEVEV